MNLSQKLGLFILIAISAAYIYFSFFSNDNFVIPSFEKKEQIINTNNTELNNPDTIENEKNNIETTYKKNIKIFVTDSKGKIRSVQRECTTNNPSSCFEYSINELIKAPSKWERSRGFNSEIPQGTKILSIRESRDYIMIDLSSQFESGGGTDSINKRIQQLIKTANANTKSPVYLYINGKKADVIGGDGIMIKQPLNEASLDE